MFSKLITYSKFGSLFCGVEHTIIDDKEQLNVLLLRKNNNEFKIESNFNSHNIADLKNQLKATQHLFLIINNQDVLTKQIEGIHETHIAVSKAFPNLKLDDFYYEVLSSNEDTFVAICRKDRVDTLIKQYNRHNFNIINFSLGSLIVSQLKSIINDSIVNTSNSIVTFNDKEISDINTSSKTELVTYNINGLKITNHTLLPLAGIISYYSKHVLTTSNFESNSLKLMADFNHKRFFSISLKTGLSSVFILLLISFLFFSNYTNKTNMLSIELETNKALKNELLKLNEQVSKKENLVTSFSLSSSKASWYLDQIGNSIPNSVLLTSLNFQPLTKNIKEDIKISTQENNILIQGTSTKSDDFSKWVQQLEQKNWVYKVLIQDYGTGKKNTTAFELLIEFIE